jgi:hypothetical protein
MLRRLRYRHQAIALSQPVAIPRAPDGAPLFFVPAGRGQGAPTPQRSAA